MGSKKLKKGKDPHVLLVDDEEGIRKTLPQILSGHGFAVTAVGNVSEALAQVHNGRYDVLVSDLNIEKPGDGFLVIAAMHLLQPKCVNMVLTGYPSFNTAVEGIRHGIAEYFVKPVEVEELVNAIHQRLVPRRARRATVWPEMRSKKDAGPS